MLKNNPQAAQGIIYAKGEGVTLVVWLVGDYEPLTYPPE
jgi:hypothetical protein